MTASPYAQYRKLLLDKRAELVRTGAGKESSLRQEAVRHADFVDQSVRAIEESVQVRLRQTDHRLLKAIDAALYRVDRGTFGICEICSEPIPAPRLNAVPWARLCRDCKELQDAGAPRLAAFRTIPPSGPGEPSGSAVPPG